MWTEVLGLHKDSKLQTAAVLLCEAFLLDTISTAFTVVLKSETTNLKSISLEFIAVLTFPGMPASEERKSHREGFRGVAPTRLVGIRLLAFSARMPPRVVGAH